MAANFARDGMGGPGLILVFASLQQYFQHGTSSLDDPLSFLIRLFVLSVQYSAVSSLSRVHTIQQRHPFIDLLIYTQLFVLYIYI